MELIFSNKSNLTLGLNRAREDVSECEAVRCNSKATMTIAMRVGDKGLIFVSVCKNCGDKFKSDCEKEWRSEIGGK